MRAAMPDCPTGAGIGAAVADYLRNMAADGLRWHLVVPVFVWQPTLYTSRKPLSTERGPEREREADLARAVDRDISPQTWPVAMTACAWHLDVVGPCSGVALPDAVHFAEAPERTTERRRALSGGNPANADLMRRVASRAVHAAMPGHPELAVTSLARSTTLSGTVFEDGWHLLPRGNAVIASALLDLLRDLGVGTRARLAPGVRNEPR